MIWKFVFTKYRINMKQKCNNDSLQYILMERNNEKNNIQRYPLYTFVEDTLNNLHEEKVLYKNNPSIIKDSNNDVMRNIDIRHTEMDNVQVNIKSEFEENNYYSLWS
jgi:hypothetical protein